MNTTNEGSQGSEMTRRTFAGLAIGGSAAIITGGSVLMRAAEATTAAQNPSTFKIGGELTINRLGFGAMRITGDGIWGWPKDRAEAHKVLKRAVELGVNLIDTADAYGPETSELLIAEALHPYPKDLVIATKGGLTRPGPGSWVPNGRPEYLKQCIDNSLKRLQLDRIDLYQLHRIDPKVPADESLGAIKEMRDAGKVRFVGLSEVTPEEIERARRILPIATIQNRYNVADRKWENALKYCEKEGLGFMPWSPIGGGRSLKEQALNQVASDQKASVYQVALAWLLQHSPVMLPIPGTSSVKHLEENMAAAKLQLTPAQLQALDAGSMSAWWGGWLKRLIG
jgi:aryl-alcohol dehydrogenase-like predicted oxidoreductase